MLGGSATLDGIRGALLPRAGCFEPTDPWIYEVETGARGRSEYGIERIVDVDADIMELVTCERGRELGFDDTTGWDSKRPPSSSIQRSTSE